MAVWSKSCLKSIWQILVTRDDKEEKWCRKLMDTAAKYYKNPLSVRKYSIATKCTSYAAYLLRCSYLCHKAGQGTVSQSWGREGLCWCEQCHQWAGRALLSLWRFDFDLELNSGCATLGSLHAKRLHAALGTKLLQHAHWRKPIGKHIICSTKYAYWTRGKVSESKSPSIFQCGMKPEFLE